MKSEYIKETIILDKDDKQKEDELIMSIIKTREELKIANINFEYAEGKLIDYYSYKIKANLSKLDYLVKKAKSKGIVVDMVNDIRLRQYNEKNEAV